MSGNHRWHTPKYLSEPVLCILLGRALVFLRVCVCMRVFERVSVCVCVELLSFECEEMLLFKFYGLTDTTVDASVGQASAFVVQFSPP